MYKSKQAHWRAPLRGACLAPGLKSGRTATIPSLARRLASLACLVQKTLDAFLDARAEPSGMLQVTGHSRAIRSNMVSRPSEAIKTPLRGGKRVLRGVRLSLPRTPRKSISWRAGRYAARRNRQRGVTRQFLTPSAGTDRTRRRPRRLTSELDRMSRAKSSTMRQSKAASIGQFVRSAGRWNIACAASTTTRNPMKEANTDPYAARENL